MLERGEGSVRDEDWSGGGAIGPSFAKATEGKGDNG